MAVTFGTAIIYVMETTHAGTVILPRFLIHHLLIELCKSKGNGKENDQQAKGFVWVLLLDEEE